MTAKRKTSRAESLANPGGRAGSRGYLFQTLVALLEALEENPQWLNVTLEPDDSTEKTDIRFVYPDGRTRAIQVKSSINPFTKPQVEEWASALAQAEASTHELVLIGQPADRNVAKCNSVGKVAVRLMLLDLSASTLAAAQLLLRFLERESLPRGNSHYLETVVGALVTKLTILSTKGETLSRAELLKRLSRLITQDIPLFPIFECPPRNPWFTGRDDEIAALRRRLCQSGTAVLGQAIGGLGGIGKTQTAIEYAHRNQNEYEAVFWINAATALDLQTGYGKIARSLRLACDTNAPASVLAAVKRWLEGAHNHRWLLIFDNLDDPPLLKPYLPNKTPHGHIAITSRVRLDVLGLRSPLSIPKLSIDDSTRFLLDRADRSSDNESEREAARELSRELDGLPLALEQAAAYVTATHVGYTDYFASYRTRKLDLLQRRGPMTGDYPATVATTWLINFEQVEAASNASADLLRLSAMLDSDAIPFELLTKGAQELGQPLSGAINPSDLVSVNEVLEPLARFSLVGINAEDRTYSIHRLVQEVVKHTMGAEGQRMWAERAVRTTNAAFPSGDVNDWPACERLVAQAKVGSQLTKEFDLPSEEAPRLLNQAGHYLHQRGQYGMAEPLLRQAMELFRQVLGEQHPHFAASLNNLAQLYRSIGRYEAAEPLFRQAMEIFRQVLGEQHPNFAASLNNLGTLYQSMGRYEVAEPLLRQAMETARRVLGEQHPNFAISASNLAELYRLMGRYEEAEPLLRQAMKIRRQALGEKHPDFAQSLSNLALLCVSTGRYKEAEPLYRQAMEVRRQVLGEQHPDLAQSFSSLALLYVSMGRYGAAEPLLRQAMEIRRQVLGDDHPHFAASLNDLAGLCYTMGRYEAAEPLFRQAMEIRRQVLGDDHPDFASSLNNLAGLYESTGRYEAAEPLYRQAMEIRRQILGEQHPDFAASLNNLATLYKVTGRYEEAEPLYRQAMQTVRRTRGEQHPHFASSLNNLAALYKVTGRYAAAEPLFLQAMEIRRQVLGEQHPDFASSLEDLAGLYGSTGRYEAAEPLYRQAVDTFFKALGPNHPNTKTCQAKHDALREKLLNGGGP